MQPAVKLFALSLSSTDNVQLPPTSEFVTIVESDGETNMHLSLRFLFRHAR